MANLSIFPMLKITPLLSNSKTYILEVTHFIPYPFVIFFFFHRKDIFCAVL